MPFLNRWMIQGRLTTVSPLHIGNGDITSRSGLNNKKNNQPIEISAVETDSKCHPYIPGKTLKGNLRAYAKAERIASFDELFGTEDTQSETAVGGKLEFLDSFFFDSAHFERNPPYWDDTRHTGVTASVAISRRTRTASEQKLFHQEFVPDGITFNVSICGQDLVDEEIEDLLYILAGFNLNFIRLGAQTDDGWGRLEWALTEIRRIDAAGVMAWIDSGGPQVGYQALTPIPDDEAKALESAVQRRLSARTIQTRAGNLTIGITIQFESNFLVNDTSQTGSGPNLPDHAPLRYTTGKPLFPTRSFRGGLRSQAEKILRTLGGDGAACCADVSPCDSVYEVNDLKNICLACKIFGAAGWRKPFKTPELRPILDDKGECGKDNFIQEFVAIDRFTGGGPEGLKFNAASVYRPIFFGEISVDLHALRDSGADIWALGLLSLLIRDLLEGDIRFGFGKGKGYGAVQARIENITLPPWDEIPDIFKVSLNEESLKAINTSVIPDDSTDLGFAMGYWVEELREYASSIRESKEPTL